MSWSTVYRCPVPSQWCNHLSPRTSDRARVIPSEKYSCSCGALVKASLGCACALAKKDVSLANVHCAAQIDELLNLGSRNRRKQLFCILMLRVSEQILCGPDLHNFPFVHDGNDVADLGCDVQVMRDKQHRKSKADF
jgi:hypothetical protein